MQRVYNTVKKGGLWLSLIAFALSYGAHAAGVSTQIIAGVLLLFILTFFGYDFKEMQRLNLNTRDYILNVITRVAMVVGLFTAAIGMSINILTVCCIIAAVCFSIYSFFLIREGNKIIAAAKASRQSSPPAQP